jgi:hypothetical protein
MFRIYNFVFCDWRDEHLFLEWPFRVYCVYAVHRIDKYAGYIYCDCHKCEWMPKFMFGTTYCKRRSKSSRGKWKLKM